MSIAVLVAGCAPRLDDSAADSADSAMSRPDVTRPRDQPPPSPEPVLITADSNAYRLRRAADAFEVDMVATFTNQTADTVYLPPCGRNQPAFMLEKWVSGEWRPAYSPPCPAILMLDPPRVAPGTSRTDTARVRASLSPNTMPRFEIQPVSGVYRLVYTQAYGSWRPNLGPGELLPLERRVSRIFRIEE